MRQDDKLYLDEVAKGIRAEIKAGSDMLNYAMQEIIKRQDLTNNRVNKIEYSTLIRLGKFAIPIIVIISVVAVVLLNEFGLIELIRLVK